MSWSPRAGLVAAGWVGAAVALALALLGGADAPGRLLAFVAAGGLAAAALFGTVARPRLTVDSSGVAVRGLGGTRRWPWSKVHRMRVVRHRRLGRDVSLLELDTIEDDGSDRLVVLGWLDLGAHPDEVLAAAHAARGL